MNQRLTFVALSVADLPRSLRFYRDILGVPLREEAHDSELRDRWYGGPHAAYSWTDGAFIHFALYPSQSPHRPVSSGAQIGFPRAEPWGRTARYLDPDRNVVSITLTVSTAR